MRDYIAQIKEHALFSGIKEDDLNAMLSCLGSYVSNYRKGEIVFIAGEPVTCIGIILHGVIHMVKEDIWGNKTILAFLKQGELFGETFVCRSELPSTVTFYVAADCQVLFLPFQRILNSCNMSCIFHHRLIENMVTLIADKNMQLMEKIESTSKKNLREKILSYLSLQAQYNKSDYFVIPLGRLELADYLCADRSALTRELSNMKTDGLLDYDKNTFHLLKK